MFFSVKKRPFCAAYSALVWTLLKTRAISSTRNWQPKTKNFNFNHYFNIIFSFFFFFRNPHVSSLSFHSLINLRLVLERCKAEAEAAPSKTSLKFKICGRCYKTFFGGNLDFPKLKKLKIVCYDVWTGKKN